MPDPRPDPPVDPRGVRSSAAITTLVAPRLRPPSAREDAAPVRFSQTVGLVFALAGALGYAVGVTPLGIGATALALAAAFLNAAFGYCLGCEMYGLIARLRSNSIKGVSV